jgi:hypothetical protein
MALLVALFRAGYLYTFIGAVGFLVIVGFALRGPLPDLERSRLRVMFVGALLGFLLPTLATVLTSSFRLPIPYNLALVPTVCFPLSVAYALLKYSLFDLGNALKIAVSRIALTVLLLAIYALVVELLGPWAGMFKRPVGAAIVLDPGGADVQSIAASYRSGRGSLCTG